MRKLLLLLSVCFAITLWADELPNLHVEGRHFVTDDGKRVLLHGVMDTPSPYFNSYRWGGDCRDENVSACINYFTALFKHLNDPANGTYCNVFRLHLDPCWTNNSSKEAKGFTQKNGKTYDPDGVEVGGEADIKHFDKSRLTKYFSSLYLKIANNALKYGQYVIMRPPGVCPGKIQVGSYYQDYLKTVWGTVTRSSVLRKQSGRIMIELANEPVSVLDSDGQSTPRALHDFFQPIVDTIRANGFEGIVLVPGSVWQQDYKGYAQFPIEDANMGYAVHCYPGWYGNSDDRHSPESFITHFRNSVPVVDTHPIVITEIDWSPGNPVLDANGNPQYNTDGTIKTKNLGTWGTATTSKWGNDYKAMKDHFGNISMTLTGTGDFIDCDKAKAGKTVMAFEGKQGVEESCSWACWQWYKEYAAVNQQYKEWGDDELTCTGIEMNADEFILSPGGNVMLTVKATYASGRTDDVSALCTYSRPSGNLIIDRGRAIATGACDYSGTVTYTDPMGNSFSKDFTVKSTYFPLTADAFNPNIWDTGSFNASTGSVTIAQYGFGGWEYASPIDITDAKYIVIKFQAAPPSGISLRLFDEASYWSTPAMKTLSTSKTQKVLLSSIKKENGAKLDLSHIYRIGFWTPSRMTFRLAELFLSEDGDTPVGIEDVQPLAPLPVATECYTLDGRRIARPQRGAVTVVKTRMSDGTVRIKKILNK